MPLLDPTAEEDVSFLTPSKPMARNISKDVFQYNLPTQQLHRHRAQFLPHFNHLPDWYPRASKAKWKTFWNSSFPHRAHTIWWRILHQKLSCKQRLHQLIPHVFTTPTCVFRDSIDIPEHFVWACPIKQSVWRSIASRYLVSPRELTIDHIISLSLPDLSVHPEFKLTFFDIIATTLICYEFGPLIDNLSFTKRCISQNNSSPA
ncbi:hypothetical protein INT45_012570 [Circinella minor]|uniref:Reverse transcriptase zinc-binding domain-containing protein n=1 Tax=Circinella minor TaxID=1195481 RepID=A0A8H7S0W5_9FUNG|nr:hypothetical protein INT45_012570 [Circinella minor]